MSAEGAPLRGPAKAGEALRFPRARHRGRRRGGISQALPYT